LIVKNFIQELNFIRWCVQGERKMIAENEETRKRLLSKATISFKALGFTPLMYAAFAGQT